MPDWSGPADLAGRPGEADSCAGTGQVMQELEDVSAK